MQPEKSSTAGRSILWRAFLLMLSVLAVLQTLLFGWIFFGPSHLTPHHWHPKAIPELSGPYVPNDAITRGRLVATRWIERGNIEQVRYQGVGPETVAVGPDELLYTGLCDAELGGTLSEPPACRVDGEAQGWVVRIDPREHQLVVPYVQTGGRPLGLAFDAAGKLYIADGRRGLLRVESNLDGNSRANPLDEVQAAMHTVVRVATCGRGDADLDRLPYYADSVAIGPDGSVWFTCPSQRWPLAEIRNEIFESRPTGRIVRYEPCKDADPLRCKKEIVADDLLFANGIAVIEDGRALLVNEWTGFRITRLELDEKNQVRSRSVFFENTPGYPDNLTVDTDGTVWVGLSLRRQELVDRFRPYPFLMRALSRLPASLIKVERYAWVIGIDSERNLAFNLQDSSGFFDQATGVYPVGDALYIGSYTETSLACIRRPGSESEVDPCDPWIGPEKRQAFVAATKSGKRGSR